MSDKLFGIDISAWQGQLNWRTISESKSPYEVVFVGIRAAMSGSYVDTRFEYNWSQAKSYGFVRTGYHVLYPDQPIQKQVDKIASVLGDDIGELPVTADIELIRGRTPAQMAEAVALYTERLKAEFGRNPIIYSRANIFADSSIDDWFVRKHGNEFWWWLAEYPYKGGVEATWFPTLPPYVNKERVIMHQTSDSMTGIGTASYKNNMDYDRWMQDPALLAKIASGATIPGTPPPTLPFPMIGISDQFDVVEKEVDKLGQLIDEAKG
jgi:GH25 family lysozyme M1 (1,4-beta-N-acetylmuramidase)